MTKTILAAALAVTFASSAFASDGDLTPNVPAFAAPTVQSQSTQANQAYAYQPVSGFFSSQANDQQREFNRVSVDTVSSR